MTKKDIKVYIVEDENIVALDMKEQLKDLGYTVLGSSSSGEDAVQKILLLNPDVILMDIMLKGNMNGIQAAITIRKEFNVPIIFLTGNTDESTLDKARVIEPFLYLLKPFESDELEKTIQKSFESYREIVKKLG